MEFGFGSILLFFVIFFGVGRMCGWGRRGRWRGVGTEEPETDHERRLSKLEQRVKNLGDRDRARQRLVHPVSHRLEPKEKSRQPVAVRQRRRTPVEELQQKFIDGRLTLSEYESELDRLERID